MQFKYFSVIITLTVVTLWFVTFYFVQIDLMGVKRPPENKSASSSESVEEIHYLHTHNNKIHIPKYMMNLYEKNRGGRNHPDFVVQTPDIVKSLIPTHASSIIRSSDIVAEIVDNHLLIFDIPPLNVGEVLVGAELKILTVVETQVEHQLKLSIYDESSNSFTDWEKIHTYHPNDTWISFNVTGPVATIIQGVKRPHLIKIIITTPCTKFKMSPHDYPILILSYLENENNTRPKRPKRSLMDPEDYEEETNKIWESNKINKRVKNACKRRPLYINFAEINFDLWIVQPTGYEAYQCQGKCFYPVADHLNPTKHALVQALLHSVAPGKVSRSCCVPTLLDSISILYVDSKGVLTYRYAYKDMVVVECGCR